MKYLIALASLLMLAACMASPESQHVTMEEDEFSNQILLKGVYNSHHPLNLGSDNEAAIWQLRSFIDKHTHQALYDVFVQVSYNASLKYYQFAADQNAKPLKVKVLYRQGSHCWTPDCARLERLSIPVEESDLRLALQTGYRIKLVSKSGEALILAFSPIMIQKQLEASERYSH